jgi:hypothetical protein
MMIQFWIDHIIQDNTEGNQTTEDECCYQTCDESTCAHDYEKGNVLKIVESRVRLGFLEKPKGQTWRAPVL